MSSASCAVRPARRRRGDRHRRALRSPRHSAAVLRGAGVARTDTQRRRRQRVRHALRSRDGADARRGRSVALRAGRSSSRRLRRRGRAARIAQYYVAARCRCRRADDRDDEPRHDGTGARPRDGRRCGRAPIRRQSGDMRPSTQAALHDFASAATARTHRTMAPFERARRADAGVLHRVSRRLSPAERRLGAHRRGGRRRDRPARPQAGAEDHGSSPGQSSCFRRGAVKREAAGEVRELAQQQSAAVQPRLERLVLEPQPTARFLGATSPADRAGSPARGRWPAAHRPPR